MPDCDELLDTLRKRLFSPMVRVKVGSGNAERTFSLPKKQVCASSTFFKDACKAEWIYDRDEAITLAQDNPKVFRKVFREFVVWVYTDYHGSHDLGAMNGTGGVDLAYKLWVLADKLRAPRLQNWLWTACSIRMAFMLANHIQNL